MLNIQRLCVPLVDNNFAAVSAEPLAMAFILGNSAKWNIT